MFQVKITLNKFKLNTGRMTTTLGNQTRLTVRLGAKVFLRRVLDIVPTLTGMARGSLIPLGRDLRAPVTINPTAFRKDRTPELGAMLQHFKFSSKNFRYSFGYATGVIHFNVNNFNANHVPNTPWEALEKGSTAMYEWLEANRDRLKLKVRDFLITETEVIQ